jgi:hypothetical protein
MVPFVALTSGFLPLLPNRQLTVPGPLINFRAPSISGADRPHGAIDIELVCGGNLDAVFDCETYSPTELSLSFSVSSVTHQTWARRIEQSVFAHIAMLIYGAKISRSAKCFPIFIFAFKSRVISVGVVTRILAGEGIWGLESVSRQRQDISRIFTASGPAFGRVLPPIQWLYARCSLQGKTGRPDPIQQVSRELFLFLKLLSATPWRHSGMEV